MSLTALGIELLSLRLSQEDAEAWTSALTPAERARADRFRQPDDRKRCLLGRGLLRQVLGRALGIAPQDVAFSLNAHGKPMLAQPCDVAFNLAHSGDYVLAALGPARAIGIDVERHRPDLDVLSVGRQVFTPAEMAILAQAPPERRHDLFFRQWTFKEAVVKAAGTGLSLDLHRFEIAFPAPRDSEMRGTRGGEGGMARTGQNDAPSVSFAETSPADAGEEGCSHFLSSRGAGGGDRPKGGEGGMAQLVIKGAADLGDPADWSLSSIPVDPGYSAALAVLL